MIHQVKFKHTHFCEHLPMSFLNHKAARREYICKSNVVLHLRLLYMTTCWWMLVKATASSLSAKYYGILRVLCVGIQNTIYVFKTGFWIYNTAHRGMLSYCRQPQNYILPFGCCFGQVCMCFQNHQPPGRDPRGDKGWRIDGILSSRASRTCFLFLPPDFLGAICSNI